MPLETPILFLVYNRPQLTAQVFEAIKAQQPAKLYIAADGPKINKEGDEQKCQQVREVVAQVDWPCEVKTLFREENIGCKLAVSSAIDWFFEQEEEGIILEDDCQPHPDFFKYCEELLNHYRLEEKVWMISGTNQLGEYKTAASHHFVRLGSIWGWATWRRAWQHYDANMHDWPQNKQVFEKYFSPEQAAQRTNVTEKTYQNELDTWDYQWAYTMVKNGGLCATPTVNLVQNIGFGPDATHTDAQPEGLDNSIIRTLKYPLQYPDKIEADSEFDDEVFERLRGEKENFWRKTFKLK